MPRPIRFACILVPFLIVGDSNSLEHSKRVRAGSAANGMQEPVAGPEQFEPKGKIDRRPRLLASIPVGTTIGKRPPAGWSHLILYVLPTLTAEDKRDAPKLVTRYASLFKFAILAKVARRKDDGKAPFYLETVACGFATTIDGEEKILSSKDTLGVSLGLLGRRVLEENETSTESDIRQILRTDTMLIFDSKVVMRRKDEHVPMLARQAIGIDPVSGRLYTLVWLLTKDYKAAEESMQLLPPNLWENRVLSIKRARFRLGVPLSGAIGFVRIPQGKAIPYTAELKQTAAVRTFERTDVPALEGMLRAAAAQAADR